MDIIRSILNQGSQGEQSELDKLLVLVDPVIHSDHHLREQYLQRRQKALDELKKIKEECQNCHYQMVQLQERQKILQSEFQNVDYLSLGNYCIQDKLKSFLEALNEKEQVTKSQLLRMLSEDIKESKIPAFGLLRKIIKACLGQPSTKILSSHLKAIMDHITLNSHNLAGLLQEKHKITIDKIDQLKEFRLNNQRNWLPTSSIIESNFSNQIGISNPPIDIEKKISSELQEANIVTLKPQCFSEEIGYYTTDKSYIKSESSRITEVESQDSYNPPRIMYKQANGSQTQCLSVFQQPK